MSKTPPPTPIDYESDWRTYDRWAQEDQFWYEDQKARHGDPVEIKAQTEAKLRSQGYSESSAVWQTKIDRAVGAIPDYETEWENRQKRLTGSSLHERLFYSPDAPAAGALSLTVDPDAPKINEEGWTPTPVTPRYSPGQEGFLDYREASVNASKEWYADAYGTVAPDNIYSLTGADKERAGATARAKGAAGGSTDALQETPWI